MRLFIKMAKSTALGAVLVPFLLLFAQAQQVPLQRSHAINDQQDLTPRPSKPLSQHNELNIIAVRVSFESDTSRFTTGNGTYRPGNLSYLDTTTISIDPLPHDRDYFESHLEFAKNYFEQVSNGQLTINYRVLPQIYPLDHKMAFYSPTGRSFSNEKLALLVRDVWQTVEARGGFNTNGLDLQNTAFAIFHAGVGRDLKLTGTSLTITPQDIPSIFLGSDQLRTHLPEYNDPGLPINDGSFHVNNSMILPRTLSRPGTSLGQDFVLQLSLNGLLTASIGSYLGLPDLFNTETGNAGIGRFGLMDGASFFSYNGLFPPEPSAWEKSYLGWQDPVEIELDPNRHIELPAVSRHRPSSIAKYSISTDEYFLVENRHRDPESDGATLTIRTPEGNTVQQHFSNDNEVFTYQRDGFDTLFTPGVVTRVDNYDFSLPGGMGTGPDGEEDTDDDRLLNGGLLIWHIDEAVIRSTIDNQRVNANPDRRGVDLEEADGAPDIGSTIGGGIGSADTRGGPFDYWWSGNNASVITRTDTLQLYENRFGPETRPNNDSNSGAPSFFAFTDFSDNLPVARFKAVEASPSNVQDVDFPVEQLTGNFSSNPDNRYYRGFPWDLSAYRTVNDTLLIIPFRGGVKSVRLNASPANAVRSFPLENPQQPLLGSRLILAGAPMISGQGNSMIEPDSTTPPISAWGYRNGQWSENWSTDIEPHIGFISSIRGDTLQSDFGPSIINIDNGVTNRRSTPYYQESNRNGSYHIRSYRKRVEISTPQGKQSIDLSADNSDWPPHSGLFPLSRDRMGFYVFRQNSFSIIEPGAENRLKTLVDNQSMEWPAMIDFDRDRRTDILYVDRRRNLLMGRNQNGAVLDNFPITPPKGTQFTGTPLVADINGDDQFEILITATDSLSSNIYGYDNNGERLSSFPLYVGSIDPQGGKSVHPSLIGNKLIAVSHQGDLKGWKFPDMEEKLWRSRYNQSKLNKVSGSLNAPGAPQAEPQILTYSETYNWPNPSDKQTHIRYQLQSAGRVQIRIITMSGQTIYDRTFQADGGIPEERQISTSSWSSGVYYAMVKATVNGQSEKKIIKIAVVH